MDTSPKRPVSQLKKSRRFALECMRLASDCVQLAQAADNALLRQHYRRAAKKWIAMATSGLPPQTPPTPAPRDPKAATQRAQTPAPTQPLGMDTIWSAQANSWAAHTIH
jgi:hypothetical protein